VGLELYAKIEPLLGFEESVEALYDFYIDLLKSWQPDMLLDIGCGSGAFLERLQNSMALNRALGIDLSETMVRRARARGIEAQAIDLCDIDEMFDAATAVFDVLNYLDAKALERFMGCVYARLKPGGIFIADINTLYGFEEVAQGALVKEDATNFVTLDSLFEDEKLTTHLTLFEKEMNGCYQKSEDTIVQYYHAPETLSEIGGLTLIQSFPLQMYGEEPDKEVLVFKRDE
jgi:SAM-dependent methyltransferase